MGLQRRASHAHGREMMEEETDVETINFKHIRSQKLSRNHFSSQRKRALARALRLLALLDVPEVCVVGRVGHVQQQRGGVQVDAVLAGGDHAGDLRGSLQLTQL